MFQVSSWDIPYLPSESMVCSTGNFSALRSSPCFPVPRVHVLRVIKVDGTEAADCEFSKSVSVKNDGCANDLLQKWPSNDAFFKKNDVNDGDIKYVPCGYFVGIWTEASQSGGFTLQQLAGMKPLNVRLLCFLKPPLLSQDSKLRFDISEDDCPIRYCQLGFLNCFFPCSILTACKKKTVILGHWEVVVQCGLSMFFPHFVLPGVWRHGAG